MATRAAKISFRPRVANTLPGKSWPETTETAPKKFKRPFLDADLLRLITPRKHRALVSDARFLGTTFPLIGEAVKQKARYVSTGGWDPIFTGEDKEWGNAVLEYLKIYLRGVSVRGPLFPWQKIWKLSSRFWDIDSDFFIILVRGPQGFPRLQVLESHRIGQRHFSGEIADGPFAGRHQFNGIVYDETGRPLAYQVLGPTVAEDRYISARNVIHVANPNFYSEGRPFPNVAYAVLDCYDIKLAREYTKTKMEAHAGITAIETTASGFAKIPKGGGNRGSGDQAAATQVVEQGLVRVIKGGNDLKAFESKTPSNEWQSFDQTLVDGAFYGMGWHVGMFDLSRLTGAAVRGFEDQINTTIFERWEDLLPFAERTLHWIVASLVNLGEIPEHEEWRKFTFRPPLEFTVDWKNRVAGNLDLNRAGGISMKRIIQKYTRASEDEILDEQGEYLQKRRAAAEKYDVAEGDLGTISKPGDNPDDFARETETETKE